MKKHSPVVWYEGMFLKAQHFQQSDCYWAERLQHHLSMVGPHHYGFVRLSIDAGALLNGKIVLCDAAGLFAEGLPFELGGDIQGALSLTVQPDASHSWPQTLYLTVPKPSNGFDISPASPVDASRVDEHATPYRMRSVDVKDRVQQNSHQSVSMQVAELNLSLCIGEPAQEDYFALPVARILEQRASGALTLEHEFIPPTVNALTQKILYSYLEELIGRVKRGRELFSRQLTGHMGMLSESVSRDYLNALVQLQTFSRYESTLSARLASKWLHPEELYLELIDLAGSLSVFHQKEAPVYPPYNHDRILHCFSPLLDDLRTWLQLEPGAQQIPLVVNEDFGVYAAQCDVNLFSGGTWVVAVDEAVANDFIGVAKVAPTQKLAYYVNNAIPGIVLHELSSAPQKIPLQEHRRYFLLEKSSDAWRECTVADGLSLFVGTGLINHLNLELWRIDDASS